MSYTDFTKFSHGELRRMAQALNSGEVMAASDPWRRAADTLKAIRATLTTASTEAAVTWEGTTSDAFHTRMLHLATTINNAASYANDAAITLKAMSEAIDQAKRNMPEEPSNWEQVKDGVGDTVSSIFGGDDEDTKTPVADQKKAEAAAVMQTLAMRYRVAAPMLKPPLPPGPPPPVRRDNTTEVTSPDDPSGSAALSAVMSSAGYTGTRSAPVSTTGPAPRSPKTVDQPASKHSTTSTPTDPGTKGGTPPADSGIKGGTAQAAPKPPSATHYGPGTGIDGTTITTPTTPVTSTPSANSGTSGTNFGTPGGQPGGQPGGLPATLKSGGPGSGPRANGGGPVVGRSEGPTAGQGKSGVQGKDGSNRAGTPGQAAARGGKTFGTGEAHMGGFGSGGRSAAGARPGGGLPGRTGGVVGEGGRTGAGAGAKQAFTEGGSGLGVRGRGKGELGTNGPSGTGPGVPLADGQRRKKDKEKDGRRPDYLVEDEETWASDQPVNPNVVE
ncbi:WXG100 family type VII secretion target [Kitasatospora sp. NPDC058170]|uniref:WXG100 family type VII secretion target n=1 Tax=Kitasatospora sp. NPDC058170 TaxID=3346364 RepID=UPI0036D7EFCF